MQKFLIFIVLIIFCHFGYSQKGSLRGKVVDGETGEGMIGATVNQVGTTIGAMVDFDGNFSIQLDPGVYDFEFKFVSYQTQVLKGVEIKPGEVTSVSITLQVSNQTLQEVIVTAEQAKDTEAAILTLQRKSASVIDGVSTQTFRKTGDSDLSTAMKRVTGVSVQGGKYLYVRGLGDRYTRTTLNQMSIPGLDPDRNDVQIDIFPTNILENVVVYKTFTPDLPGDFTGGVVNIETKSFPEQKNTSIQVGLGFNPSMHFNNEYATYDQSPTDFLGFDNGQRAKPFPEEKTPDESRNDPLLEQQTRSLNPQMATRTGTSPMNFNFALNHGNQKDVGGYTLGYSAILNYRNNTEYYDDVEFGFYTKDPNKGENDLFLQQKRQGVLGRNDVMWSALVAGAIKKGGNTISLNLMRTQNGVSQASNRIVDDREETGQNFNEDILTYTQRSITNFMVSGQHILNNRLTFEWSNAFTVSRMYDPDFRVSSIAETGETDSLGNPTYSISSGDGGSLNRFYRDLNEWNENVKLDLTYDLNEKSKLKFGAYGLLKSREFNVFNYFIRSTQEKGVPNDPNYFLQPENIWTPESQEGTYVRGNFEAQNSYSASSRVFATYAMADLRVSPRLRAIFGARIEKADMFFTGQSVSPPRSFDNVNTLNELNLLPSVNLVYFLTEKINVRTSYGRTLARPSMKEKSIAQILDPISNILFIGNFNPDDPELDLRQTVIDNFDLRVEKFFNPEEMVSLTGFYKSFDGHIELVTFESQRGNVRPRNVGSSVVYGAEFEFRKKLGIKGLSGGSNISLAYSQVDTRTVIVGEGANKRTEYESRVANAREGEKVDPFRPMAGQAPYLINAFLNWSNEENNTNVNLAYNVQGENLYIVGVARDPSIYVIPFNSLNLTAFHKFGEERNSRITLGIRNILNGENKYVYRSYGDQSETFSVFRPGQEIIAKYQYSF